MRFKLCIGLLAATLRAQDHTLDVVPLQTDPEQIARALRDRTATIPRADCSALDLWECTPDEPRRSTDVSLRWVQLDDDPELEAVLVVEAPEEDSNVAYVFDRQGTWRLVGSFFCRALRCDAQNLIRIQQLTKDSPRLLWVTRDLGGSGSSLLTTEMFQLREGKLWPVMQLTDQDAFMLSPYRETQTLLTSDNRIVIHTAHEEPPGREVSDKCEVRRWAPAQHAFIAAPADQAVYCDAKTGKPIPGKSHEVLLPRP